MNKSVTFYIGEPATGAEVEEFLKDCYTGLTVTEGRGIWSGVGERSIVAETVIADRHPETYATMIARALAVRFGQDCVGLKIVDCGWSLVGQGEE